MGSTHYRDVKQHIEVAGIKKVQGRRIWENGGFTDYVCLRFDPERLHFRDIDQGDPLVKVRALAQLRYVKALSYGRTDPRIILWLRLREDPHPRLRFPGVSAQICNGRYHFYCQFILGWDYLQSGQTLLGKAEDRKCLCYFVGENGTLYCCRSWGNCSFTTGRFQPYGVPCRVGNIGFYRRLCVAGCQQELCLRLVVIVGATV